MPDLEMSYPEIENLISLFGDGEMDFAYATSEIHQTINLVSNGALHGKIGDKVIGSLGELAEKLDSGSNKFRRIAQELEKAMNEIKDRDSKVKF